MAQAYTKDFLIACYLYRFSRYGLDTQTLEENAFCFYDDVGRDKFREYASVTPELIREYKQFLIRN